MKVTQSCLTLCDPIYYTVHGILQARILEWVAFPFSRWSSVGGIVMSIAAFPSPGDLPNPGIEPKPPTLQVNSLPAELSGKPLLHI